MRGGFVRFVAEACWMGPWLWRWLSLLRAACFFVLESNVSSRSRVRTFSRDDF